MRFEPVTTRRIRLVEAGPGGRWSVAELFLLEPSPGGRAARTRRPVWSTRAAGSRTLGSVGPALQRYHEAMRSAPDDPAGYVAFARLSTALRASDRSAFEHAARLADLGLLSDARAAYADLTRGLGPGQVHAELWRLRARLAAADGDLPEAARLAAEADAALAPARPIGAVMGRVAELLGYDVAPQPLRAGEARRGHDALAPARRASGRT